MTTENTKKTRTESDLIGAREVPYEALYGVQTLRGMENFPISHFKLPALHQGPRRNEARSSAC